jgi:transcription antitermination factor NusG
MNLVTDATKENVDAKWFAFSVKPQHELAVGAALEAHGVEGFVPVHTTRRRWSDRMKTLTLPLFTGYVFCHVSVKARLPILRLPGVRTIVGFGGEPAAIADEDIAVVRRIADSGLAVAAIPHLQMGERVRVIRGPLRGVEGTLLESAKSCLVVGIELLHRSLSVEIDPDALEAVAHSPARIYRA